MIISPLPPSCNKSNDVTPPRVTNKCLTTWGFTSTTFTGEKQQQTTAMTSSWSVTVERNVSGGNVGSQRMSQQQGYMFGLGVSRSVLNVKDLVGMNALSYGIVCSGGMLRYCHDGQADDIAPLEALPLTLTVSLNVEHAQYNVLTYRIQSCSDKRGVGSTLIVKKILHDAASKEFVYPVFTVSQKVKLLFPTSV